MRRETVLKLQGVYFMATGLWPVAHMASFEAITGPKTDDWLVKMVGLLAFVIGLTLYSAARRRSLTKEILVLAIGSAMAFTIIDLWYALAGRISLVYLGDAVVETALVAALLTLKS